MTVTFFWGKANGCTPFNQRKKNVPVDIRSLRGRWLLRGELVAAPGERLLPARGERSGEGGGRWGVSYFSSGKACTPS